MSLDGIMHVKVLVKFSLCAIETKDKTLGNLEYSYALKMWYFRII